ncbi:MAG: hemolysin family protein [Fimbriimonas sp.]
MSVILLMLAFLTAYEMAVFSTRPEHIRRKSKEGDARATIVMSFLRSPVQILSALQVGSTFASLTLGALAQPHLTDRLSQWLHKIGLGDALDSSAALVVTMVVFTLVTLVFANLIPKRIAYAHADAIAIRYARLGRLWIKLMSPISWSVSWVSDRLLRLARVPLPAAHEVVEADLVVLLDRGMREGTIDRKERDIIQRAFLLSDIRVDQVMSPRDQIDCLQSTLSLEDAKREAARFGRSRLIVSAGNLDDAVGTISVRRLLACSNDWTSLVDPILRVPPTCTALHLLEQFRNSPARLALVVDEFGHAQGLVALNDLVQVLLGEVRALQV